VNAIAKGFAFMPTLLRFFYKESFPYSFLGCSILISRSILGILEALHLQIFVVASTNSKCQNPFT
jgi:hypothetical protein